MDQVRPKEPATQIQKHRCTGLLGGDLTGLAYGRGLSLLILVGLIIRIGFFMEHCRTPSFAVPTLDQKYYDTVAKLLLTGGDLHQLHGFRPLLYPAFLAACYRIGGDWGPDLALFLQHLLGVATAVLVALLGARVFKHRLCGLAGGCLFLLAPVPLYFEGELLIEPGYTFLICAGLLLHCLAAESQGRKGALLWTACGALLVLTAQARANILVFLAVYPAFVLWRWWHSRRWTAPTPLIGLLGAVAMAVPWGFVNLKQSDHFHLLPNAGGVALYLGNKRTADGLVPEQERRILSGEQYEDSIEVWAREEYVSAMKGQGKQPDPDPMAISKYWTKRAVAEIKADPMAWMRLMAKKTWLTFWNAEIPNNKAFAFLQLDYVWLRILPVRWVVLLMFAPVGVWWAWRRGNRDALFILLLYTGLYSAANIVFFICDRYRYPVWPAMAVFAGGGLVAACEIIRLRKFRPALWITAAAVFMASLSLFNWAGAKLPSFARDYLFRSFAWYEKGRFEEALADVNRSVELDPREATSFHHRGNVLFALNRSEAATESYAQALQLSPKEAGIWNNLGAALEALGRTDAARNAFSRATACTPPSLKAFLGAARLEIRRGNLDRAIEIIDNMDRQQPTGNASSLTLRSIIERLRGHTEQADALEKQASQIDPAATEWVLKQVLGSNNTIEALPIK